MNALARRLLTGPLIMACLSSVACGASPEGYAPADPRSPLSLQRVIELPRVTGRIDHLAADMTDHLLFVAEIASGSVDDVDYAAGAVIGRIAGLHEPQGVAYLPASKQIVVACGDGSVHFYDAADRHELARLDLGDDADNVRVDARNGEVIVGYGKGGLAIIDPSRHRVLTRVILPGHPEGFRLVGARAYVNVPDRQAIVVADIDRGTIIARWQTGGRMLNFPMAAGPSGEWIATVYRFPATLAVIDPATGRALWAKSTCGDSDDLYRADDRFLVVCGSGHVDLLTASGSDQRVATAAGARTGLYLPELRTLFIAVPARRRAAAIWALALRPEH